MEAYFSLIVAALTGAVAYIFLRKRKAKPAANPVAEADVYIAYGRTHQAVEILESALKTNPNQPEVAAKLAAVLKSKT